ncbi:hypothetical protein KFE25_007608 [Diacronema lutheri]|uniref:Nucleotide-diphospho-sugar transferase domain-containing protein n=1 Tax=Diacronema lutheri TaxID=2081491 RepID=A0A8J5Y0M2_DIALT|nr:hypothetical protein KFE25_007608 [Diacronema lutheri]
MVAGARSARRALVAIATTVWVRLGERGVNHADVCGIVKWCRDAAHFSAALPILVERSGAGALWNGHADVVVSTNDVAFTRSECPQPRIIHSQIEPDFLNLTNWFAHTAFDRKEARQRILASGVKHHLSPEPFDRALLTKWALVGLVRYELVLCVDNDVDFFEAGRRSPAGVDAYLAAATRAWAEEVPRFRASPARLLGTADMEAPVNMGMVWLKPSRAMFEEGVALLRTGRFSYETGFNMTGRPLELMDAQMARTLPMNRTRMIYLNTWNVVAGASDQGLFSLVFMMRHRALRLTSRADYTLHHFWSSSKPWVRLGSCLPYFYQLGLIDAPGDEAGRVVPPRLLPKPAGPRQEGHCWPVLRRMAAKLISEPSARARWKCRGASFTLF